MCDDFLQRYASMLNDPNDTLQPITLFFSDINCSGTVWPPDYRTPSDNSTVADIKQRNSLFVPFHQILTLSGVNTQKKVIVGPQYIADISKVVFDGTNIPLIRFLPIAAPTLNGPTTTRSSAIVSYSIESTKSWSDLEPLLCGGQTAWVGVYPLVKWQPATQYCDNLMLNTFCASGSPNRELPLCACIKGQDTLQAMRLKYGVDFPVTCFDKACVESDSYRTASMKSEVCNSVVCKQNIQSAQGIFNQGSIVLYCNGEVYDTDKATAPEVVTPTVSTTVTTSVSITPTVVVPFRLGFSDEPFYTWLILGVAVTILFGFMIMVLFWKPASLLSTANNKPSLPIASIT